MKLEFAKYYDVTKLALSLNREYEKNGYIRIYICCDVHSVWLVRVMENMNDLYEYSEGTFLVERDELDKYEFCKKGETITLNNVKKIIEEDEFEIYDTEEFESLAEVEEALDSGFGLGSLS